MPGAASAPDAVGMQSLVTNVHVKRCRSQRLIQQESSLHAARSMLDHQMRQSGLGTEQNRPSTSPSFTFGTLAFCVTNFSLHGISLLPSEHQDTSCGTRLLTLLPRLFLLVQVRARSGAVRLCVDSCCGAGCRLLQWVLRWITALVALSTLPDARLLQRVLANAGLGRRVARPSGHAALYSAAAWLRMRGAWQHLKVRCVTAGQGNHFR